MKPRLEQLQDIFDRMDGVVLDGDQVADYRTAEHIHGKPLSQLGIEDVVLELYDEKFENGDERPRCSVSLGRMLDAQWKGINLVVPEWGTLRFFQQRAYNPQTEHFSNLS